MEACARSGEDLVDAGQGESGDAGVVGPSGGASVRTRDALRLISFACFFLIIVFFASDRPGAVRRACRGARAVVPISERAFCHPVLFAWTD